MVNKQKIIEAERKVTKMEKHCTNSWKMVCIVKECETWEVELI